MKHVTIFVVPIVIILLLASCIFSSDKRDIKSWAAKNKVEVVEIDQRLFSRGPYYVTKDRRIYKVTTSDGIYWFRYGNLFGNDIEKESGTSYIKIK